MRIRIREAAQTLGISPDKIRDLERQGLLTIPRDCAGHRRFTEDDLLVLEKILFGQTTSPPQESEQ